MLKICWTEVANEEVLVHANEARSVLKAIWHMKHRCLRHLVRHKNFICDIIEGKLMGAWLLEVGKGWSYCMI